MLLQCFSHPAIQTNHLASSNTIRRHRMCPRLVNRVVCVTALLFSVTAGLACNKAANGQSAAAASDGKIPISTKSGEAKKEFLQGQDLADRLLAQESLAHFIR